MAGLVFLSSEILNRLFFIGNEGMYSEEKQENKPSVVELGVLCVPWVLRSSGMTAVS